MGEIIKFETHKYLFEQSWGRCIKKGLEKYAKLTSSKSQFHICDKKDSLIKAFRKSVEDINEINNFSKYLFFLTDEDGIILDLILLDKNNYFYLNIGMALKEEFAGTNAVSLAINEKNIVLVKKQEHYLECFKELNCIAGPIFDSDKKLIGIAGISSENELSDNFTAMTFLLAKYIEHNYYIFKTEKIKQKFDEIEIKILKLTAEGRTDEEIAEIVNRSPSNVKYHKSKIFQILKAKNIKDCIYKAGKVDLI